MKMMVAAGAAFVFALILLTSPYWLYREITRSDDEELPDWMGDARARKVRLLMTAGLFSVVFGFGALFLSFTGP